MTACDEVDAVVGSLRLGDANSLDRLDELRGIEPCLTDGLARSAAAEDWLRFEQYLIAAARFPDRSMTPVLCEVLSRRLDTLDNEAIVEALEAIADPAAVDCLERAIWWRPSWDEFGNLAVKSVWALAAIGTPEAREVLRDAAATGPAAVREAARHELDLMGR